MDIGDKEFHYFPSHLDDQPKIFMWDMDEAMAMFASIGCGILLKQIIVSAVAGIFFAYLLAKVKARRGRGFLAALVYWYLPHNIIMRFKRYPPSYIREYAG
jgi:type IV conjugative transfer system protein TraL